MSGKDAGRLGSGVAYVPRLKKRYLRDVVPALVAEFGYANPMMLPRFVKVVLNMGLGEAALDSRVVPSAVGDLAMISGQKPVVTRARKAISAFKLREGMPIGAKVTLRGFRMYDFLDQLSTVVLPRVRDFRGLKVGSFDGSGNYSIGIREHFVFPTVGYDKGVQDIGMDVTICTSARTDGEAKALLALSGFPFRSGGQ